MSFTGLIKGIWQYVNFQNPFCLKMHFHLTLFLFAQRLSNENVKVVHLTTHLPKCIVGMLRLKSLAPTPAKSRHCREVCLPEELKGGNADTVHHYP